MHSTQTGRAARVPPDDAISNEKTSGVDYNFALADRYTKYAGIVYLAGMQALVRLLIEQIDLDRRQGLRTRGYVSGYRGSPVGAFDSALLSGVPPDLSQSETDQMMLV